MSDSSPRVAVSSPVHNSCEIPPDDPLTVNTVSDSNPSTPSTSTRNAPVSHSAQEIKALQKLFKSYDAQDYLYDYPPTREWTSDAATIISEDPVMTLHQVKLLFGFEAGGYVGLAYMIKQSIAEKNENRPHASWKKIENRLLSDPWIIEATLAAIPGELIPHFIKGDLPYQYLHGTDDIKEKLRTVMPRSNAPGVYIVCSYYTGSASQNDPDEGKWLTALEFHEVVEMVDKYKSDDKFAEKIDRITPHCPKVEWKKGERRWLDSEYFDDDTDRHVLATEMIDEWVEQTKTLYTDAIQAMLDNADDRINRRMRRCLVTYAGWAETPISRTSSHMTFVQNTSKIWGLVNSQVMEEVSANNLGFLPFIIPVTEEHRAPAAEIIIHELCSTFIIDGGVNHQEPGQFSANHPKYAEAFRRSHNTLYASSNFKRNIESDLEKGIQLQDWHKNFRNIGRMEVENESLADENKALAEKLIKTIEDTEAARKTSKEDEVLNNLVDKVLADLGVSGD